MSAKKTGSQIVIGVVVFVLGMVAWELLSKFFGYLPSILPILKNLLYFLWQLLSWKLPIWAFSLIILFLILVFRHTSRIRTVAKQPNQPFTENEQLVFVALVREDGRSVGVDSIADVTSKPVYLIEQTLESLYGRGYLTFHRHPLGNTVRLSRSGRDFAIEAHLING